MNFMRMFSDFNMLSDKAFYKWNIKNHKNNSMRKINNNRTKGKRFREGRIQRCSKEFQEY
jgi:hypothetical protein